MEQIYENVPLQSASADAPSRRSLYLRFVVILLAGFGLTNVGVAAFAQSIQPVRASSNPFLEYADIFPGHTLSETPARPFFCWTSNSYNHAWEVSCRFTPASEVFSRVEIILANGIIRQTSFTLRDNLLNVGELVLLFDEPRFRAYPGIAFFFWSNLFVLVSTTATGNPAAIRPVWSVTFTHTY